VKKILNIDAARWPPRGFYQTRILAVFDPFREVKMPLSWGASFGRENIPCEQIETGATQPPPGGQIGRDFQSSLTWPAFAASMRRPM